LGKYQFISIIYSNALSFPELQHSASSAQAAGIVNKSDSSLVLHFQKRLISIPCY